MIAEVLPSKQDAFIYDYKGHTGEDPVIEQGFFIGRQGTKVWGLDFRVFFEPKADWVIDSLDKIGYKATSDKKSPYKDLEFPFLVSDEELFWWLIGYGYRLGENEPILFEEYEKNK